MIDLYYFEKIRFYDYYQAEITKHLLVLQSVTKPSHSNRHFS